MRIWFRAMRLGLVGLILTTPMLVMMIAPESGKALRNEARLATAAPGWPPRPSDWLKLPHQLTLYLNDHFGLREVLTHAHAVMEHLLLHAGNENVMVAGDGRFFTRDQSALEQSAGVILRRGRLVHTADVVARVYQALSARGVKFIYMPAPNAATIETADLPAWARNPGRATEYDVLLELLRARGVPAGDMRPAMQAAVSQGSLYLFHDSHWNARGALIGFNAAAALSGHSDWQEDPAMVLAPPSLLVGGDLARMLGISADVEAMEPEPNFQGFPMVFLGPIKDVALSITTGLPGPRVLILGDSFTEGVFSQFLARHVAEVVWVHHKSCAFDWNWIEQAKPDEVWWIPTERFAWCGTQPTNLH